MHDKNYVLAWLFVAALAIFLFAMGFLVGYYRVIQESEVYQYNEHMMAMVIDGHEYYYFVSPYNMPPFSLKP